MVQAITMYSTIQQMKLLIKDVLDISEMRWLEKSYCNMDNFKICCSGMDSIEYKYGVVIILQKNAVKYVSF